jgi:Tfp pilus assembly PilM family ATPase
VKRRASDWSKAALNAAQRMKPAFLAAQRLTTATAKVGRAARARLAAVPFKPNVGNLKTGGTTLARKAFAQLKNVRIRPAALMPLHLSPIGIDIGTRVIKAAQLARVGGTWRLHAQAILPRTWPEKDTPQDADTPNGAVRAPDWSIDDQTVTRLLDVLDRRGFSGRQVVLCAPSAVLQSDLLDLPPRSSGAPIEQIAKSEMARSSSLQGAAFEMACWDLPAAARAGAGTSVLAVALRHADADALTAPFERYGVDVIALDAASCALARAIGGRWATQRGAAAAVADLGFSGASLVLLGEAGVLYQRHLRDPGVASIYQAIMDRYDASEEVARRLLTEPPGTDDPVRAAWISQLIANYVELLVEELHVSFAFSAHRYPDLPLRRLLLTGGGASFWGLAQNVRAKISIDVILPGANDLVEVPDRLAECATSPALATAIGLAAYGQSLGSGGAPS